MLGEGCATGGGGGRLHEEAAARKPLLQVVAEPCVDRGRRTLDHGCGECMFRLLASGERPDRTPATFVADLSGERPVLTGDHGARAVAALPGAAHEEPPCEVFRGRSGHRCLVFTRPLVATAVATGRPHGSAR